MYVDFLRGDSRQSVQMILSVTQGKTSHKASNRSTHLNLSVPLMQEVRGWSLQDLGNTQECTQTISMVENSPMLVRM